MTGWSRISRKGSPETINGILALGSIETGGAGTLINVNLTVIAREADGAVTHVPARLVLTHTLVQAGVGETLVYFQLAAGTCGRTDNAVAAKTPRIAATPINGTFVNENR